MSTTSNTSRSWRRRLARFARLLRSGLLGRFVLVLGAVGLIPLIIVPWLVELTRDSVVDQILTTHSVAARSTADRVDAWIRSIRISAQTLSSNPYLLSARRDEVAQMVAGLLQADPAIKGALVVNSEGLEVGGATLSGFGDIVGPALTAATSEPVTVLPGGGGLWIRIATALDEGQGELRLVVDGSALSDILTTEEIGRDAIIGLFDVNGRMLASSNVSGQAARFPPALLAAGRERATSGAARYDDAQPVVAGAYSPVAAARWFVASTQPAVTAERVASRMRSTGFIALFVAALLTAGFSALGYITIIKPIDEIARSQWRAAKRGEKSAPVGNEIDRLKSAFQTMRRQTLDREAIGKLFLSRYLVLDILGTGGMGSVFRGWDPKLERPVAIKTVHLDAEAHASVGASEQRQVLLREAVTVAKFNHPNIVSIYDVEDGGAAAFLAMEFVEGMSLESLLGATGVMRVELATPLIMQIARGLAAAHNAGVIHCDIKPANILLGKDGAVKVTDFGIARSMMRHTGNIEGTFGTPGYLPPEALGSKEFTPAADLFGVGAMFYELLTGAPPHAGRTAQETLVKTVTVPAVSVREKNDSVPPAIDEIILGLLEKAPEKRRPASARELADALEAISDRNGWKWSAPPALASGDGKPDLSEQATAAIPAGPALG